MSNIRLIRQSLSSRMNQTDHLVFRRFVLIALLCAAPCQPLRSQEGQAQAAEITKFYHDVARSTRSEPGVWHAVSDPLEYRTLYPGYWVRTRTNSWAWVKFYPTKGMQEHMAEMASNTTLSIPDDEPMKLLPGLFHFFSRTSAQLWKFVAGQVSAGVHGTDFM